MSLTIFLDLSHDIEHKRIIHSFIHIFYCNAYNFYLTNSKASAELLLQVSQIKESRLKSGITLEIIKEIQYLSTRNTIFIL